MCVFLISSNPCTPVRCGAEGEERPQHVRVSSNASYARRSPPQDDIGASTLQGYLGQKKLPLPNLQ